MFCIYVEDSKLFKYHSANVTVLIDMLTTKLMLINYNREQKGST